MAMKMDRLRPHAVNQLLVIGGVMSRILSCGLGMGYLSSMIDYSDTSPVKKIIGPASLKFIDISGEIAFLPAIVVIPFMLHKRGRRVASFITSLSLLLTWIISFSPTSTISLLMVNSLYHVSLGGTVAISSVIISEFSHPKYRAAILMLETAMISIGVLISHLSEMYGFWNATFLFGFLTAAASLILTYFSPESPYWLISTGQIVECTEVFYWSRGYNSDSVRELEALLITYKLKFQLDALKPIIKMTLRESVLSYVKSLLNADFLKPLSIMILLFSFVGVSGENPGFGYSFRDLMVLPHGKYISTIILDVVSLVCSLTACVLVQIVKRKTLFMFTGSFSMLFLGFSAVVIFLQSLEWFVQQYMWLLLSFATGFAMFISLGTTALPFSLLGEIFPMSYKGVGSSLTCAYLWALSNSILKSLPLLTDYLGLHGLVFIALVFMAIILAVLCKIMPEVEGKTLLEIEELMKSCGDKIQPYDNNRYEVVDHNEASEARYFDTLNLFMEV